MCIIYDTRTHICAYLQNTIKYPIELHPIFFYGAILRRAKYRPLLKSYDQLLKWKGCKSSLHMGHNLKEVSSQLLQCIDDIFQ